ncbi:hypothetical protein L1887_10384 [Cichorium endivia]|nr:hypothetical protein L1887_10384 [Cichorium endivia]
MGQQLENTTAMESSGSFDSWRLDSPLIYLFCGIGAMLALVMVALFMLACSQWRGRSTPTGGDYTGGGEHPQKTTPHVCNASDESNVYPKMVVVMAGDEIPTYLAAPVHVHGCGAGTIAHLPNRSL